MTFPSVEEYYDKTRFDYRYVWNSRNTHAIHFGYYDEGVRQHVAAVANMNRKMAELAGIKLEDLVLDAGCGVGGSSFWLAENIGCNVTGITLAASQVADAQKTAAQRNLSHKTHFQQADYCATDFKSNSYDIVWALESQCHAADKAAFYREAFRLLKPNGRLVIAEYFLNVHDEATNGDVDIKAWYDNIAIPNLLTWAEHEAFAKTAGFKTTTLQNINPNVRRSLLNAYEHCEKWLPAAKWLNRLGIVNKVQVGNVLGTAAQYRAWEKDLWFYGLAVFEK